MMPKNFRHFECMTLSGQKLSASITLFLFYRRGITQPSAWVRNSAVPSLDYS